MALETSGFQLSQFDRAPNIPGNIGVVDTKAIYASVSNALKQNETLRTLQQVQGLNDAQTAYQTAQAQGLLSNLPDTLAADKAKSQLFAAQTDAALPDVGLAQQANRTGYQALVAKNTLLSDPAFVREQLTYKNMSPAVKKLTQLQGMLDKGDLDEDQALAVRRAMGQELTPAQKAKLDADANKVHTIYNNEGVPVQFTNSGAMRVPGGNWMTGSQPPTSTGTPLAGMAAAPVGGTGASTAPVGGTGASTAPLASAVAPTTVGEAPALQGASVFGMDKKAALAAQAQAKSVAKYGEGTSGSAVDLAEGDEAKTTLRSHFTDEMKEASKALRIQNAHLASWADTQAKDAVTIAAIDRLRATVERDGYKATGGGPVGEFLRNTANTNAEFASDLKQVTSLNTIGTMLRLKAASATGATGFGQLSNQEGEVIRDTLGSITGGKLSPAEMVAVLDRMKSDLISQGASAKQMIESQISQNNAVGWRASVAAFGNPKIAVNAGFTPPAPTSSSEAPAGAPQPSAADLAFGKPNAMIPGQLTFRSPEAPENRFEVSTIPEAPPSSPAGVGGFEYAPEMPSEAALVPTTPKATQSGLRIVSDSSAVPEAAPQDETDATTEEAPPPAERDGSLMTAAAGAATAAPLAVKYAPRVAQAFSNPRAQALRAVAQLKRGLPGLSGSPMGAARLGGAASAAFGTGYLAGEAINKYGPTITDAFGFTNTKKLSDGKSPMLSDILSDWYMESKQPPAVTLGDRWADAYRAIWGIRKLTDEQRAEALASLRETRNNWTSAGYKLSTPVEEFDKEQLESAQR